MGCSRRMVGKEVSVAKMFEAKKKAMEDAWKEERQTTGSILTKEASFPLIAIRPTRPKHLLKPSDFYPHEMIPSSMPRTAGSSIKVQATRSAALRTFAIAELLEQILLELPALEIFVTQRISHVFNETIADSPALQRKMFHTQLPASQYPQPPIQDTRHSTRVHNVCAQGIPWNLSIDSFFKHLSNLQLRPFAPRLGRALNSPSNESWSLFGSEERPPFGLYIPLNYAARECDPKLIGWLGKKSVHPYGSWERIKLGAEESGIVNVTAGKVPRENSRWTTYAKRMRIDGTMGELVGMLRN